MIVDIINSWGTTEMSFVLFVVEQLKLEDIANFKFNNGSNNTAII